MTAVNIIGTDCVLTDARRLAALLEDRCREDIRPALSVDFTNVHIVAMRTVDPGFQQSTANVDCFVPDSQVLCWAASMLGAKNHERVYGPSFLDHFIRHANPALTHYFLGASAECLRRLVKNLRAIRPDLKVVGFQHGYFQPDEEQRVLDAINAAKPDVLWVGLGTPRQQEWISRHKDLLDTSAVLAVGFAFDVNAGTKKDAPGWMGPLGLTWLYRLACEPRRLTKRYLYYNTIFLGRLFHQFFAKK